MIIGDQREAVIANIAAAARSGDFHSKVELNDPAGADTGTGDPNPG